MADAKPVRRLHRPLVRVVCWLLLAALLLVLVMLVNGVRPDLALKLQQPVFVTSVAAAIGTGILAAAAAFIASVPGRSRRWLWMPLPSLAVWMGTIGYGCLTNWVEIGPEGMSPGETARCFATLVVVSTPLAIALTAMLRYVARLSPAPVAMCAGLAVAAIAATSLLLIHPLDASAMVLLWNLGVALLFVGAGSLFGHRPFARMAQH
ncbi:Amino acid transporter (plasmid) [Cupriavidus necator H850]|uniref:NrsF family protein n=1 Tax=Cupriavidus necator TaxID=106590 RepID=UPI0020C0102A|nr:NrsF family protein [Cupriavidus necator]KAI3610943.1 Amino acid transporter [Cupriavidus necator H850]